jgi:hypothetical protein
VYSVNQDGAVPAALGQLQRTLGDTRYDQAIARGLEWEFGANEIAESLVNEGEGFVARAIESNNGAFRLSREMYAYQPARCLYALLSDQRWSTEVAS